jgi:hypothetical protein
MENSRELQPDYHVTVSLDGANVDELSFIDTAFSTPKSVMLTPETLRGHSTLEIIKHGKGVLYTNIVRTYTVPSIDAVPLVSGISVHRTYRIAAEDPIKADSISSGQDIEVQTEITADENYKYAVVEDPIPAGCEVDATESFVQGGYYIRREVRDNRVVFFFDNLPKGKTEVTYRLHAETPGIYRILPSIGSLAYFPEIRGNSAPVRANITEK